MIIKSFCSIYLSVLFHANLQKIFLFIPISAEKIKANTQKTLLHFPPELAIKTFKEQKQTTLP